MDDTHPKTSEWRKYYRPDKPLWWFGVAIFSMALLRSIPVDPDSASFAARALLGYDSWWDSIMPPGFKRVDIATPVGFVIIVQGRAGLDMVKAKFGGIFK